MDHHALGFLRRNLITLVIMGVLGLMDWAGWLDPVKVFGDLVFNPIDVKVYAIKSDVNAAISRFWGTDSVSSELLTLRQLLRGETQMASEIVSLKKENESLRSLVATQHKGIEVLMGSVIERLEKEVIINVGSDRGVQPGMAVLANGILCGQVSNVQKLKSSVKLLNAQGAEWRVAVVNENGERVEGIMDSQDGDLEVRGLLVSDDVSVGDAVISVGDKELLPDLPIGKVLTLGVSDETSLYQSAAVAWPIDYDNFSQVAVVVRW